MNITSKGQVTIPQRIRNRYGFKPGMTVEFMTEGDRVFLVPTGRRGSAAKDWLRQATGILNGRTTTARAMKLTRGED